MNPTKTPPPAPTVGYFVWPDKIEVAGDLPEGTMARIFGVRTITHT